MSRRDRIRRKNRSKFKTEPAPREIRFSLPSESNFVAGRVRQTYNDNPVDNTSRDNRRIDTGINLHDVWVQNLRRLQILADKRRNNIDTTGVRYDYRREIIGRDEVVSLPKEHPICREREERRQILFAKNKTGRRGQRPPRLPKLILKCSK